MTLFSIHFLIFLAILIIVYFSVARKKQWVCLLIFSYLFYLLAGSYKTVLFLIFSTISVYFGAVHIEDLRIQFDASKKDDSALPLPERRKILQKKQKRILVLVLILNLGLLGIMKYSSFVISSVDSLILRFGGLRTIPVPNFLLPLGISFYTFQSIGYIIDVYRERIKADRNLFQFALFVSYFPQIIQGPISRYEQLASLLYEAHSFDLRRFKFGLLRMLWGFFKKMVIADRIGVIVDEVFLHYADHHYVGFTVFVGALLYGVQIYADFSGGIDIVLGISELLGITQTENFRQPFMARSVSEFWQRWHITLGAWMREYPFYSLALSKPFAKMGRSMRKVFGNRAGKIIPTCTASFIVFVLVGIWHGAAWKFIVYGLYQAIFVSTGNLFERGYARIKQALHINEKCITWNLFQMVRTTVIITFGRYLSRAASFREALGMWRATFRSFNPWIFFDGSLYDLGLSEKNFRLMLLLIALLLAVDVLHERGVHIREALEKTDIIFRWTVYFAAIFAIIIFGVYGPGYNAAAFIYQGF